ncbi:helix-turn-helix domain-containing protein [Streptomyces sp. NPDC002851]
MSNEIDNGPADEASWDVATDDEVAMDLAEAVGRQIKSWREERQLRIADFAKAMGYGEDLIRKVERGARIPTPECLDLADQVLDAHGHIKALKPDAQKARYPKKVRDLAKLERRAIGIGSYNNSVIDGLLQTREYAEAVIRNRQPPFPEDEIERRVAGRMDRQGILDSKRGLPVFTFVQCESTLRLTIGGTMVMRRQLEHLLEMGRLPNVSIQVLPLNSEENASLAGPYQLLKLNDGTTVAHMEVQHLRRLINNPRELQILEYRYGMIQAQALDPMKSLAFIEKVRGQT